MNLYIVQMSKVIALNILANKPSIYMMSQAKYQQYQWQLVVLQPNNKDYRITLSISSIGFHLYIQN